MEKSKSSTSAIERGMQLAADLPDIMPDQASEQIKPLYEDIQRTLRVPITNLIFRTLANYPDFLQSVWHQLRPTLQTENFERYADDLRKASLLEPTPHVSGVDWERVGDLEKIRAFNDTIHYVLPKLLLVTTAFERMAFNPGSEKSGHEDSINGSAEIPLGAADGTTKVEMVDPDKASDQVKELFSSIKERHRHPIVSSYFRGLGNWPVLLQTVWIHLQPIVGSSDYEEQKRKLIEQSESIVKGLSLSNLQETGLDEKQIPEVQAILAAFRLKFIPEMLLDATLIKAMLDGAEKATSSRFSAVKK